MASRNARSDAKASSQRIQRAAKVLSGSLWEPQDPLQRGEAPHRQQDSLHAAVFNAVPAHMALLDLAGRIVEVNEAWSRFAAENALHDGDSCVGQNYLEVCDAARGGGAEGARQAATGIRAVLNGETAHFTLEYPCHSPGEKRWFRLMATPLYKKQWSGAVVMHINITDRVLAENELRRSESHYRALFANNPQPMYLYDRETLRFLAVNDAAVAHYGYSSEEFRAMTIEDLCHPEVRAAVRDVVRSMPGRLRKPGVWRQTKKDGTWIDVELTTHDHEFDGRPARLVLASDITKKRTAEVATIAAQRELNLILASVAEGIHGIDLEGRILYENSAALAMFGWKKDEMIGQVAHELIHHHRADGRPYPFEECPVYLMLRDGITRTVDDEVFYRKDGSSFPVEYTCSPLRDEACAIIGGVTSFRDISEHKRTDKRLAILNFAQDQTHEAMYLFNEAARILEVNEEACRALGYSREELLTMGLSDYAPEFPIEVWQEHWKSIRENGTVTLQSFSQRKNLAVFPVEVNATFFEYGGLGYVLALVRDISERKESERQLAEQAALLDQASDGILVRDLDDRVIYWSRGAEIVYGWTGEEVLGKSVADFLYQDPASLRTSNSSVLESGAWSGELQHRTKQGEPVTVLGRCTLLRDSQGQPKSVLALYTDITLAKKLEQQYLRAQRMESIGTLAGGIAHDLNNILSPILLGVEMLQDDTRTAADRKTLETLKRSAERGVDLIKQVLGFARGVEGKHVRVNPIHIAREIQRIAQDTFPKNIAIKLSSPPDIWSLNADPTQLHQVLMNLFVNARDAMPEGGTLSLIMKNLAAADVFSKMDVQAKPGPYVIISVKDTGCGMTMAVQEKIFEPFFTTKGLGKGTGLGLSTAFSIVRDNGGFIKLYSEPGKGTKFSVYWPAAATLGFIEDAILPRTSPPRGNGELVLVVDDEESIREMSKKVLERYGYRVMLACNGAEGVSAFVEHRGEIQAILTDMSMPVMDGPTMSAALKSIDPNVRIIGSSGLSANGDYAKAFAAGVDHFIPKPYTAAALMIMLRDVLSAPDSLPAKPVVVAETPSTSSQSSPAFQPGNSTVLLVNDDVLIRELLSRVIESEGYKVLAAGYAEEALQLLREHDNAVDVVITDVIMPGEPGHKLSEVIRELEPGGHRIPIIMLASGLSDTERQRCFEAGASDFLKSPSAVAELKALLKKWTGRFAPPELSRGTFQKQVVEEHVPALPPAIDVDVLADFVGSDPNEIERFLNIFLQSVESGDRELRAAVNAGNCRDAAAVAHKLKSAARSVGAETLGKLYEQIEGLAADTSAKRIEALLPELERCIATVVRAIGALKE